MRRRFLLASPLLALRLPGQPAPAKATTAEQIVDRFVEVTGGKAARLRVKTQTVKTRVEIASQGIKGVGTMYRTAGISYSEMEIPGVGKMEEGVYKGVAWDKSAMLGARVKKEDESHTALRAAAMDVEWNWRNHYTAELGTAAESTPEPSDVVVMKPKAGGHPETRYYSQATGLLIKLSTKQKSPMGEIPMNVLFSDYRDVDGVKMAFKNTVLVGPQQMEIIQEAVQNNVPIPPAKLVPPADILALIGARPATPRPVSRPKPVVDAVK
jgi:zinc protease